MKPIPTNNGLVVISFGYWAQYICPVEAATQAMTLLVKAGAISVSSEIIAGQSRYIPKQDTCAITTLDKPYMADCPIDETLRNDYLDWIKTKYELIGKTYIPESYAKYLTMKEAS